MYVMAASRTSRALRMHKNERGKKKKKTTKQKKRRREREGYSTHNATRTHANNKTIRQTEMCGIKNGNNKRVNVIKAE